MAAAVETLAPQVESYRAELVIAEGGSTDNTDEVLAQLRGRFPWIRVVANPGGHPATGLNRAICATRADVIIRVDAHTRYSPDFIESSLRALAAHPQSAVGGPQSARGNTSFGRAVATAMQSRLGVGPASFRHSKERRAVDTVYLGAYRRELAFHLGGYRAFPSRAGEDADFYRRARDAGFRIFVDPSIRSTYLPRETPSALAKQSYRYGVAKAEIFHHSRGFPSWRPLAPLLLTTATAASVFPRPRARLRARVLLVPGWLSLLFLAGRRADSLPQRLQFVGAAALMQYGYGIGLLVGLLRGRRRTKPLSGLAAGWCPGDSHP